MIVINFIQISIEKFQKYDCLDVTDKFLKTKNFERLFFKDKYGGHLNKNGNKFVSNIIYKELRKKIYEKSIIWITVSLEWKTTLANQKKLKNL